jgi:hypothetical protein
MTPSPQPVQGAGCSYYHILTESRSVGLSEAVDLGSGLVLHHATDGNACYREWNLVLHDCTARELVVVGPDRADYLPADSGASMYALFARIEAEAAAGRPMTLDALTDAAVASGYAPPLRVPVGTTLSINGHRVPTACACATFYPRP